MATSTAKIIITADDKTKAAFAGVQRNLAGIKSFAGGLGLGAAFSVAGIVAFTRASIDALDNLNDLSKKTNVTVEDLTGLDLAARSSGTNLEALATSFNKLSVNIGKNREEYTKLGVTAKDPLEAFKQLADIFNSIQDPQDQAAFGAKAFGKAYAEIVPLLKEGGDNIGRLVARGKELSGVTQEMANEADKFNDQLEEFKTVGGAVGFQFAKVLLPSFNDTLLAMRNLGKEGHPLLALLRGFAGLGKIPFDLAFPAENLKEVNSTAGRVKDLKKELSTLQSDRNKLAKTGGGILNNLFAGGDIKELDQRISVAKNQISAFEKFADQIDKKPALKIKDAKEEKPTPKSVKSFISTGDTGGSKGSSKAKQEIDKLAQSLAELKTKSEEAGRSGQALELYKLSTLGASNAQLNLASSLLSSIDAQEKQQALIEKGADLNQKFQTPLAAYTATQAELDALLASSRISQEAYNGAMAEAITTFAETDQATKTAIESAAELNAILAQTPSAELEKTRDTMRELYAALEAGKISAEQFGEAVHVVLGQTTDLAETATDDLSEFGKQAARNIQDSFADFLFDPFAKGLGGLLDGFTRTVQRMVAEAAAANLAKSLFGDLIKGGEGSGILGELFSNIDFGSIFGFSKGGAFNQGGVMAFASGGIVNGATPFTFGGGQKGVLGEAGPEGILPLRRGANGKLGVELFGGSKQSAVSQIVNMYITTPDANSFRQSQGQILADANRTLGRGRRNL